MAKKQPKSTTHKAGIYRGGPKNGQPTGFDFDLRWVASWQRYVSIPGRDDD
jgi:hypothetical protein